MGYLNETGLAYLWGKIKTHVATQLKNNVAAISSGGTGATTAEDALTALLENKALPISKGRTGATTVAEAKNNLGLKYVGSVASARGSTSSCSLAATKKTVVPLDTWIARTDNAFTFSNNGIKCPYDGVVQVSGNVYVSGGGTRTTGCYVLKNGAETVSQYFDGGAGGVTSGMCIIPVNAGDVLTLNARMSVAGTCAPNNPATILNVAYIR